MTDLPNVSQIPSPPTRWMWAGRSLVKSMVRSRFDNHVWGVEHVPPAGPLILASNHMGYVDGPLLFGMCPRPVHALVKVSMFEGRVGRMLALSGQIPVDRSRVDPLAVKRCLRVLADGNAVAIYPEGERGRGAVERTKGGAAYLALVTGAPVVPVACLGTRPDGADTSAMPLKGSRLDTVFGAPVTFDPVSWPRTRSEVAAVQAQIQEMLAAHVRSACEMTGQTLPALPLKS